ncbi:hypothetical protein [Nocardia camponoti]|uniref:Uridine kinase n=1 Tax=Nocardia camponoti TaxID=1616106 RepID=A0A917QB00_9NOCA|nr:hypothetical protein [Nocardia camponoti]GGK40177.1 hypothetical protein GCM10011591_09730 [Nocardia camponoti]
MPTFTPITPSALAGLVAERLTELPGRRVVAVDGADAARPTEFAELVVAAVRATGRSAAAVSLHDYVRPASLRMEYGRTDELSYRTAWFDYAAIDREVLTSLRESARWLPALWDEATDRSARARVVQAPEDQVLLVAGPMLLGRALPFDLSVRLELSEPALRRTTPPDEHWTLPALATHTRLSREEATWTARWDHPARPALRSR